MFDFINLAKVITIKEHIIKTTIDLRKSNKIKLPDAIIAATAIAYDLTLLTRNVNDFKNLKGLRIYDPMMK